MIEITGLKNGMVMQRNLKTDCCEIYFEIKGADTSPEISVGELVQVEGDIYRLEGIPTGGPYDIRLSFSDEYVDFSDIYVGDVWVLAGQSNMEGAASPRQKDEEFDKNPINEIRAYYHSDEWSHARSKLHQQWLTNDKDVLEKYTTDNKGHLDVYGEFNEKWSSGVGTGVFIGKRLHELFGVPQGLIPCAFGGSNMEFWSGDEDKPPILYKYMMSRIRKCGNNIRGIFWYQGEAETYPEGIEKFNCRMENMITQVRKRLNNDRVSFVQAQIGHTALPQLLNEELATNWHKIRILQSELEKRVSRVSTVSAANSYLQDLIHIDAQSQEEIGKMMAEEMFRLETGNGTKIPSVASIEVKPHSFKKNMYEIVITYDDIIGELVSHGRAYGFSLTHENETPFEYPYRYISHMKLDKNKVIISVEHTYLPPEEAYLWYGAGFSAVCNITDSAGRALLAFGPVKVVK